VWPSILILQPEICDPLIELIDRDLFNFRYRLSKAIRQPDQIPAPRIAPQFFS